MPDKRIAFISVHGCPMARLGARDTGGMNVYIHRLASALGRLGFRVDIFTRSHEGCDLPVSELDENTRLIHLKAGPPDAPKEALFGFLPAFLAQVEQYQRRHHVSYQLVHTHYWLSGWVGMALAGKWRVPHVTTFHTLAEIKSRALASEHEDASRSDVERQVVASAGRIVVSTNHEKEALCRLYDALRDRVRVVPAGVDLSQFQPGDQGSARDRLSLDGHFTMLYVGRMEPIKGLEVLMHTVASLETSRAVKLLVIGGGRQDDPSVLRMKGLAQDLGIQDKVEFLGSLDHATLPLYYQAADVCVVPSYYESFGLVALEAMACGTPVVASRVPGLQAIVRDNRSGYLVPWHCPDAFADKVEMLAANEALRRSLGKGARVVAQELSWDRSASGVAEAYAGLGVTPVS